MILSMVIITKPLYVTMVNICCKIVSICQLIVVYISSQVMCIRQLVMIYVSGKIMSINYIVMINITLQYCSSFS